MTNKYRIAAFSDKWKLYRVGVPFDPMVSDEAAVAVFERQEDAELVLDFFETRARYDSMEPPEPIPDRIKEGTARALTELDRHAMLTFGKPFLQDEPITKPGSIETAIVCDGDMQRHKIPMGMICGTMEVFDPASFAIWQGPMRMIAPGEYAAMMQAMQAPSTPLCEDMAIPHEADDAEVMPTYGTGIELTTEQQIEATYRRRGEFYRIASCINNHAANQRDADHEPGEPGTVKVAVVGADDAGQDDAVQCVGDSCQRTIKEGGGEQETKAIKFREWF